MVAQSIMALTCVYSEMTITIGDIKALVNLYGGQCTLVGERMTANNAKHALETKHRLESAIKCLEWERTVAVKNLEFVQSELDIANKTFLLEREQHIETLAELDRLKQLQSKRIERCEWAQFQWHQLDGGCDACVKE